MSADHISFWLLFLAAPAASLFAVLYGSLQPWWRSWAGRALLAFSGSVAAMVDISLLYRLLGAEYQARDALRLTVFSLVGVSSWLMLIALLRELVAARHRR